MFKLPSNTTIHKEFSVKSILNEIENDKEAKQESRNIDHFFVENILNSKITGLKSISIKEIYFYRIELKDYSIPWNIIIRLDKKTKFQTIYNLKCNDMELILTLPKTKERIDYNKDKYLSSGWNKDKDDIELPPTPNSLDDLYCFVFGTFNKYKPFKNENLDEYVLRLKRLIELDNSIEKINKLIKNEVQPKKRLLYNHQRNQYYKEKSKLLKED